MNANDYNRAYGFIEGALNALYMSDGKVSCEVIDILCEQLEQMDAHVKMLKRERLGIATNGKETK